MSITEEQATRVVRLLNDAIRVIVNAKFRGRGFIVMPDRDIVFFGGGTEDCHIPSELRLAMITRIKLMAGMDISVHDKLQVGRIKFKVQKVDVELIVQTRPTRFGEEVMVRVSEEAHEPQNDTPKPSLSNAMLSLAPGVSPDAAICPNKTCGADSCVTGSPCPVCGTFVPSPEAAQ